MAELEAKAGGSAPVSSNEQAPESLKDQLLRLAPNFMGPLGIPLSSVKAGAEALDRIAYKAGEKTTDLTGSPELGLAANVAVQAVPTFLGGGLGAKAEPVAQNIGKRLMQSALKPDKIARESGKGAQAVKTMLDEGINVTHGGANILRDKVDDLQAAVATILDRYPNASVDKQRVYDALSDSISKAMKQGTPQSDIAVLNKAVMDFAQHPLLANSAGIPVKLAQELKQGVWRKLKDSSFGPNIMPQAERDAQKAIGRGLREGIEDVAPEVGPINARTQEFLNSLKMVEQRVGAEGNKNIIGLGSLSPNMHNFLAWMLDRYPAGKSMLARYFYSHADPEMAGRAAGATLGATQGRSKE